MGQTMKWWKVLPVVTAVLALGACGGGGGDGGGDDNPGASDTPSASASGSIIACFTADRTISYAVTTLNGLPNKIYPNRQTVGPVFYNGQPVTGETESLPSEGVTDSGDLTTAISNYWTITNNGVQFIAMLYSDGTVVQTNDDFYPQNMQPGQTTSTSDGLIINTFIGFETFSLAGKTFTNTCHFRQVHNGIESNWWVAPGYGIIKSIATGGSTTQYNGDL